MLIYRCQNCHNNFVGGSSGGDAQNIARTADEFSQCPYCYHGGTFLRVEYATIGTETIEEADHA
jgi:DNA-directed RNA polymerase subunit RPC12/RpoP